MRVLAIDTASEACSVALFEDDEALAKAHEILGRGHAERLVPMIAELPERGRADRILVSLGPGSFTGVRIGLATARALGIAWHADVVGYRTLALVAAMAQGDSAGGITVCMNGGHGQWFVQNFDNELRAEEEARSLSPEEAKAACRHRTIAGNRAAQLADLVAGNRQVVELLPDAAQVPLLAACHMLHTLAPIYGRPPDARPPA